MAKTRSTLVIRMVAIAVVFGLSLLLVTTASAQSAATSDSKDGKSSGTDAVAGQQVAIDPSTKKLRQPTQEEVKELTRGMKELVNRSTEGLKPVQHPEGYISVVLEDRFMNAAVAKVNPDGTVSQLCVTTVEEAQDFLEKDGKGDDHAKKPADVESKKTAPQPAVLEEK